MKNIKSILISPESKTLEFKRDLSSLKPILKTIVAFANTAGGILIIGKSSDGKICGVPDVFRAEEMLASSIADSIAPSLAPEIETMTVGGSDLLVVKVPYWKAPFFLKQEGKPRGVYIRLGSTSRPASLEVVEELSRIALNVSYDEQPLPQLSMDALDRDLIKRVFGLTQRTIPKQKLTSIGVLAAFHEQLVPSVGGILLFGRKEIRERWTPDARVRCALFGGADKSRILDQMEVEGTLFDAAIEVPRFLARNTKMGAEIRGLIRENIPEYPMVAMREILINALAHTDYSQVGSHIQVAIYEDRVEVISPGMFPFGFTLEDFKSGVSRVRNRVIAKVFRQLNLMEEWGSGYERAISTCQKEGYPQPKWEELTSSVKVTLLPYSDRPRNVLQETFASDLSMRQEWILDLLKNVVLPFREILERLPLKVSERTLRYDLSSLKKMGLIYSKGKGPATLYLRSSWESLDGNQG